MHRLLDPLHILLADRPKLHRLLQRPRGPGERLRVEERPQFRRVLEHVRARPAASPAAEAEHLGELGQVAHDSTALLGSPSMTTPPRSPPGLWASWKPACRAAATDA